MYIFFSSVLNAKCTVCIIQVKFRLKPDSSAMLLKNQCLSNFTRAVNLPFFNIALLILGNISSLVLFTNCFRCEICISKFILTQLKHFFLKKNPFISSQIRLLLPWCFIYPFWNIEFNAGKILEVSCTDYLRFDVFSQQGALLCI